MTKSTRIPGFYKLSLAERRTALLARLTDPPEDANAIWDTGGLSPTQADLIIENVLGIYALPLGVALNALINGEDRLLPMVVEEPSVVAACSGACKMIRTGGGFSAEMNQSLMIAQIEVRQVPDLEKARAAIEREQDALLEQAGNALPGLLGRGGGPRGLEFRVLAPDHAVVHLLLDCLDAMGANLANTAAEAVGPRVAELCGGKLGLRILSNLSDQRTVTVKVSIPVEVLSASRGMETAQGVAAASLFAERDPYRAATHNKGIMNGVDSVVIATGNDYRAVEAGAHSFAAKSGSYRPLSIWRAREGHLHGEMTLPLALGIVGGTLRVHAGARLSLALSGARSADDLALLAACAGLASNLAALCALATEGIQKGHMSLHARSVAVSAGAHPEEVDRVAEIIARAGTVTLAAAQATLQRMRSLAKG